MIILFGVFLISLNLSAWQKDGMPIASGPGDQTEPRVAMWGNDFVVVYKDWVPNIGPKLRAAKLNGETGEKIWDISVVNDTSTQGEHQIALDKNGMTWVVFEKTIAYPPVIGLQILNNNNGNKILSSGGINVSSDSNKKKTPQLCLDGSGEGCYITWTDYRSGGPDIWAAKVTPEGVVAFEKVVTRNTSGGGSSKVLPSLEGDALVLWGGRRPGDELGAIFGQGLSPSGEFKWDTLGILIDHVWEFSGAISDKKGGALVFFAPPGGLARANKPGLGVKAQAIDDKGNILLSPGGIRVADNTGYGEGVQNLVFANDGSSGYIISHPYYAGYYHVIFEAKRFDPSITPLWDIIVWEQPFYPYFAWWYGHNSITNNVSGECIVAWDTESDSLFGDIFGARIDASGNLRWTVPICSLPSQQNYPVVVADSKGGAYIFWQDARNGDFDIYGQHVDSTGAFGIDEYRHPSEPVGVYLLQFFPNPFKEVSIISFQLPISIQVSLKVYKASGQLVRTLVDEFKNSGYYSVCWDGKDNKKNKVSAGVYFYQLRVNDRSITKKIVLVK